LSTLDAEGDYFAGRMTPGAPMDDAPVAVDGRDGWLLEHTGNGFVLLLFGDADASAFDALASEAIPVRTLRLPAEGVTARRYDARPGTAYLIRPDQLIAARWRQPDPDTVRAAVRRATCNA
jgi:3-(3-hydroxy-phenyl)propionate hydroxylase